MLRIPIRAKWFVVASAVLGIAGSVWLTTGLASTAQTARWGGLLVRLGLLGLLFMAGVVIGGVFLHRGSGDGGGGGGGGGGGETTPPVGPLPVPDPIDLELRRLLEEEASRPTVEPEERIAADPR